MSLLDLLLTLLLQMERQALHHALQEAEQELQLHQEIAMALASHQQGLGAAAAAAGVGAFSQQDHSAVHGMLLQRVETAKEQKQRQRRAHNRMVEEAALAAANAAEGFHTDGAGSSGSGSV